MSEVHACVIWLVVIFTTRIGSGTTSVVQRVFVAPRTVVSYNDRFLKLRQQPICPRNRRHSVTAQCVCRQAENG